MDSQAVMRIVSNRHLRPPSAKAHISETPDLSSSDSTEGGKAVLRAKSASVNCPSR